MGTHTAEVEVLTAEVSVLRVGSRQVTMSVYRQLDRFHPFRVQPFGRVQDSQRAHWMRKSPPESFIQVVGRHRETGALVRSDLRTSHYLNSWWKIADEIVEDMVRRDWEQLPLIVLAGLR